MQTKRYDTIERQVIPQVNGVDSRQIVNSASRKTNFHGIRFEGTIISENLAGNAFGSGFITLMCIPNQAVTVPVILNEADLKDAHTFIIAVEHYETFEQDNVMGETSIKRFSFAPKSSRTCAEGGFLVGQVTNTSPTLDMVITTLLSSFETIV